MITFDASVHDTHTNKYLGVLSINPDPERVEEYMTALRTLGYDPHIEEA